MAKIWLKIWLKVKENGTKKNQIGENGGERKRNPSANPVRGCSSTRTVKVSRLDSQNKDSENYLE